jgi:UrcA family protein
MNTSFKSTVRILFGAAALVGAMGLGTAQADEAPSVHVSYADLNLSSVAGAKSLYRRITVAANNVCPTEARDLARHQIHESCVQETVAAAVRDVNAPQLSTLYVAKNGEDIAAKFGVSTPVRTARN